MSTNTAFQLVSINIKILKINVRFFYLLSNTQNHKISAIWTHNIYLSYVNISHVLYYEGWNFNSGNYLFTTDTK